MCLFPIVEMHLFLQASIGVLLLCTLSRSNEYEPFEPLVAEASQQNSQYASVASFNQVSDARPQYQAVASFSSDNSNGKALGSTVVNNNGQVSQFASGKLLQFFFSCVFLCCILS